MTKGAGAWVTPKRYQLGTTGDVGSRVYLAVSAIQDELARQGRYHLVGRGTFGTATKVAVQSFQRDWDLADTGVLGPAEAKRLWVDHFTWWQAVMGIPSNLLMGLAELESAFDPGAEGSFDADDRGICQFSRKWHPDISDELAYGSPPFCIQRAAHNLRSAYDGLGEWHLAVAHHNNPSKALRWKREGVYDDQIVQYVFLVYSRANAPL